LALGLLLSFFAGCAATPDPDSPQYTIESEVIGARFGTALATWTVLPFNRTYSQLSDRQKALVRSYYVAMAETDEPPYPADGLRAIFGPIASGQSKLMVKGDFDAEVVVGADGVPIEVLVFRSPHKSVTTFIANLAMLVRFKPAVCGGVPCRMNFPIRIGFKIQ
jgi:hypothetical protein